MADLTRSEYKKLLALIITTGFSSLVVADTAAVKSEILVTPTTIKPDANRVIRFAVGVNNVPLPGLSSFALDLAFSGPINLVQTLQNLPSLPLPADKITCSASLNPGAPSETIVPNVLTQLQSGLGDFFLGGKGAGTLLALKNEFGGSSARYAFGLGGDLSTISPKTGAGSLIEFRCMAGTNFPNNGQITVTPKLIPGNAGALFLFGQGSPIDSNLVDGVIRLADIGSAPVAHNDELNSRVGETLNIDVVANDTDTEDGIPAGELLVKSSPGNGSVSVINRQIRYVPNTTFKGRDSFTYAVKDSQGLESNTATVQVHVGAINSPPRATDDQVSTQEDSAVSVALLANDEDPDQDGLALESIGSVSNGSLSVNGGTVTYTPKPNYHGVDSFSYTVNDGRGGVSSATVQITVVSVNDLPLATPDQASTSEDQPVTVSVLGNDSDVDNDLLGITAVTQGSHGSVEISGGQLTYRPDGDFFGNDSFQYTVSDGHGGMAQANVSVTVTPLNDAPVAVIRVPKHQEINQAIIVDGTESFDVDKDALSFQWTLTPPTGSKAKLNLQNTVSPLLTPDLPGDYRLKLVVTDANGTSNSAESSFNAADPLQGNIAPNALIASLPKQVPVNTLLDLDGSPSFDPDSSPNPQLGFAWKIITTPSGSSSKINSNNQVQSGLIPDVEGEYTLELSVSDGAKQSTSQAKFYASSANVAPVADAGNDQVVSKGSPVLVRGLDSYDADDAANRLSFNWALVRAPTGSNVANVLQAIAHSGELNLTPDLVGDYLFRLDIADPNGNVDFDQVLLNVRLAGDLDFDNDVDTNDLNLFKNSPTDINKDGVINVLDYRAATLLCTRPKCATQ